MSHVGSYNVNEDWYNVQPTSNTPTISPIIFQYLSKNLDSIINLLKQKIGMIQIHPPSLQGCIDQRAIRNNLTIYHYWTEGYPRYHFYWLVSNISLFMITFPIDWRYDPDSFFRWRHQWSNILMKTDKID